jgi:hypothetical protein
MGLFRSTDPTTWDDVDGIVVNESAPAPNVAGVAANIAILVGQAERGTTELFEVGSIGQFHEKYGKSAAGMNLALKNKRFGRLRCIRVVAANAAVAQRVFDDGGGTPVDIIRFEAKQGAGAYGNNIQIQIQAGSSSGKRYTIRDVTPGTVMTQEVYDNVTVASLAISPRFAGSALIKAVVLSTAAEPANTSGFVALASGSDGTLADTDYQEAIAKAEVEGSGNVLFLDAYNASRNNFLKQHVQNAPDKMVILCGLETDTVTQAVADVVNYRDTEGRIIYAYPWIESSIDGVLTMTAPASWLASVISQTAPNVDPAFVANAGFLTGITSLKRPLSRADYIQLKEAGVLAFQVDAEIGFKIRSGIVTQIADSSKVMILRRRMADFLTQSAGRFLKNYQNAVNSKENRQLVKGALLTFVQSLENDGILPRDAEVSSGSAKLIDVDSLNTDSSIASGRFQILWRQRIYSSMRFIILTAEIGESVVVTEQGA